MSVLEVIGSILFVVCAKKVFFTNLDSNRIFNLSRCRVTNSVMICKLRWMTEISMLLYVKSLITTENKTKVFVNRCLNYIKDSDTVYVFLFTLMFATAHVRTFSKFGNLQLSASMRALYTIVTC